MSAERSVRRNSEIMMFYVSEAAASQVSNIGRDVTLLVASCVTALGVVSLVCLHCLSRKVSCRRRSAVYAIVPFSLKLDESDRPNWYNVQYFIMR